MDKYTDRQKNRQVDQIDRCANRQIDRKNTQTDQTDRWTTRQTDRKMDRQIRQMDGQI